jgi:hypothetical protein
MKKALQIILEDKDVIELMRILLDDDTEGALAAFGAGLFLLAVDNPARRKD